MDEQGICLAQDQTILDTMMLCTQPLNSLHMEMHSQWNGTMARRALPEVSAVKVMVSYGKIIFLFHCEV